MPAVDPTALRQDLNRARLLLVFSPASLAEGLAALEQALPWVDMVQVRPKLKGDERSSSATARDWTRAVLELVAESGPEAPLVMVNDHVDVAALLREEGCAGVHLGQNDCPPSDAREFLGPDPLIGLSTHSAEQVAAAWDEPVDYLGFGPIFPSQTKASLKTLGADRAWIAASASTRPLFPIGGIDATCAAELGPVGRAAVAAAILEASDPGAAAQALRALLQATDDLA